MYPSLADYADAFHIARVLDLEEFFVKREPDVVKFLHSFHKTPYRLGRIE